MSTNCLVTKLKGSVENEDLQTLGAIRVKTQIVDTPTFNTQRFSFKTVGPVTLKVYGEECYCDTNYYNLETNKYTEVTVNNADTLQSIFVSPKVLWAEISPKYNLKYFGIDTCFDKMAGNLEPLEYCTNLEVLHLSSKNISGDISLLSNLVNMITLNLQHNPVSGDIASLGKLTSIQTLDICYGTNIIGNIEDFVIAQYDNGRTSVDVNNAIQSYTLLKRIKFGGQNYNEAYGSIGWESRSKMFVYAGVKQAVNCTRVYCKGYTQIEAETKWPNLTIIRIDA